MAAGQKVSGIALASIAVGSLFLYAGIRGKSISSALQLIIQGKDPRTAAKANQITGTAAGGGNTMGPGGAPSANAAANQALARLIVAASHPDWATGQKWADWVALWNRESGWDSLIMNPGSGAFGIAQALGHGQPGAQAVMRVVHYPGGLTAQNVTVNQYPSKAANSGSAQAQIHWGIDYIAQTYGDPSAAWAHEESEGWY